MADIIVGYDGSDAARAALDTALEIAGLLGDDVVVAFGYEIQKLGGEVKDYAKAVEERAREAVDHAVHHAEAQGAKVESVVIEGSPAHSLSDLAVQRGARMIVIGSQGESPIKGAILGSTAHKLLYVSEVPVLVVPAR